MRKVLITIAVMGGVLMGFGANVTCKKCNGSGSVKVWETCGNCKGKGLIGKMNRTNLHGNIEVNECRCPTCSNSIKLGMVKKSVECPKCKGAGSVGVEDVKVGVKKDMGKCSKAEKIAERNSKLIADQEWKDRMNVLKYRRDKAEKDWKKMIMDGESVEKKMKARELIAKYENEIAKMRKARKQDS